MINFKLNLNFVVVFQVRATDQKKPQKHLSCLPHLATKMTVHGEMAKHRNEQH